MAEPLVSSLSIVTGDISGDGTEAEDKFYGRYFYNDHVDLGHGDSIAPFGHPLIENTSYQYSSLVEACYSDEKPLWWMVLRWLKMMLMKTARSYHAKPLLLFAGPLFLGFLIGFFVGKWHSTHSIEQPEKSERQQVKKHNQQRLEQGQGIHLHWIEKLVEFLSAVYYSLRLIGAFIMPPKIQPITHGNTRRQTPLSTIQHPVAIFESKTKLQPIRKKQNNDCRTVNENDETELCTRENKVRSYLQSDEGTLRESDVPVDLVPRHVAVIMDGNRRYGKMKYGSATRGHWDGSSKLVEFAKWCIAENISVLTVYAFSSENWKRDPSEIASLMQIFTKYCDELRIEAIQRNIKIMVLSTDYEKVSRVEL